jgi:hypothetical protein
VSSGRLLAGAAAFTLGLTVAIGLAARSHEDFPHEAHTGLFPLCTGCHVGIATGDPLETYPEPGTCRSCHDGVRADPVDWTGPAARLSVVRFDHLQHASLVAGAWEPALDCADCHTAPDAPRMRAEPPIAERCLSCHAHPAREHFGDAECLLCHAPLAEGGLVPRLARLPLPESHQLPDFLAAQHGRLAAASIESCATCHTREQCMHCHLVAPREAALMPAAGGRFTPPPIAARYSLPESHLDPQWPLLHGDVAADQTCSTCHTRESCTTCHRPPIPAVITALPARGAATAPGVFVLRRTPESHASPFFRTQHGALASARPQTCATCHERRELCSACHDPVGVAPAAELPDAHPLRTAAVAPRETRLEPGPRASAGRMQPARTARGFHPPDYLMRHAAEAFGRRLDCTSCHSTPLFCRDCHTNAGIGTTGRLGPGYHDAQPVWLLRHGQAARQTLESCTSCHTQRDCMQCHSQLGAFRVSPHGPGFDARRAHRTNPQVCRACHLTDPLPDG